MVTRKASFDEIAAEVGRERRELMGQLLAELACQNQMAVEALSTKCPTCAGETDGKGQKARGISHMEGETKLERAYRYCGKCGRAFFPLDEQLKLSQKSWSPETIRNPVQLGVEIASYERAAAAFETLTQMPMSKSSLQRLVVATGAVLVAEQEVEAQAMVQVPQQEEEVM